MVNWNPSAPSILGNEFAPSARTGVPSIVAGLSAPAQVLPSTVTESISSLVLGLSSSAGLGRMFADVYAGASVPAPTGRTTRNYYPTADVARVNWTTAVGGTTNLWAAVDDVPETATYADSVWDTKTLTTDYVRWRLGTAAFPASRRVTAARIRVRYRGGAIAFGFLRGGVLYGEQTLGFNQSSATGLAAVRTIDWGEVCPWTLLPWTQADMVELSNGTTVLQMRRADKSAGYLIPNVTAVQWQVVDVAENRVAFATGIYPGTTISLDTYTPTAGGPATAGWAKAAATTYTIVPRVARATWAAIGSIGVARLDSSDPLPAGAPRAGVATLGDELVPTSSTLGAPGSTLALALLDGATTSVDSVPWSIVTDREIAGGANRQRFVPATSASYGVIRAAVKPPPGGSLSRLRVRIRRVSDNVALGGEGFLTREQAIAGQDLGNGVRLAQVQLGAAAALVAGTAYYVDLSVAGDDTWRVMLLQSPPGVTDPFGPATVAGAVAADDAVWSVQVAQLPAALAGDPAVDERVLPVLPPYAPDVTPCADDGIGVPSALVSWPATGLGGAFARYEIQRADTLDPVWRTIASIEDPATTEVYDHEVRLGGVETRYRVRQIRADGIGSEWITSSLTRFETPDQCRAGMVWSSNLAPGATVLAPDVYDRAPVRSYTPQEAEELTLQPIYGRDGLAAFRPLEKRGVSFSRRLLVDALVGSRARGETVFGPLRALTTNRELPYVCVRDSYGDRWFASVNVTEAQVSQPHDVHTADVDVVELTEEPAVVTAWNGTLGDPWAALPGSSWGVDALDRARLISADVEALVSLAVQPTPFADQGAARVALNHALGDTASAGLAVKVVDAANWVGIVVDSAAGTAQMVKVVGGTREVLGTWPSDGTGGIEIRWSGTSTTGGLTLTPLDAGVVVGGSTIADAVFDGASRAGLVYEGATSAPVVRWDRFEAFLPAEGPGGAWTAVSGVWRTDGGSLVLHANSTTFPGRNITVTPATSPDVQIHAQVTPTPGLRLLLRYQDVGNYLYLEATATGWKLGHRISAAETDLVTVSGIERGPDVVAQLDGDRFRLRTAGVWRDVGGPGVTTYTLPPDAGALQTLDVHGVEILGNAAPGDYSGAVHALQIDPVSNLAAPGAVVAAGPGQGIGGHVDVLRRRLFTPDDLFLALWGIDDVRPGPDPVDLAGFAHGLRTVLSRALQVTTAEETAVEVTLDPDWQHPVAGTDRNTGTGWVRSTTPGATIDLSVAGSAARGRLVLRFLSSTAGNPGGTATVTVDGTPVDTVDTHLWTDARSTVISVRLPALSTGAHLVQVEVDTLEPGGSIEVDGWGFEASSPDQIADVVVGGIADVTLSPSYHSADRFGPSLIGDTSAEWETDAYVGRTVAIYAGTGAGQTRVIASNSDHEVWTTAPWTVAPDASSDFLLRDPSPFGAVTPDDVAAYNSTLAAVVAEFPPGWIQVVDVDAVLRDDARMFADGLHPDEAGHRAIAQAIAGKVRGRPAHLVVAGNGYAAGVGARPNHGLDDHLRRALVGALFADSFVRPPVARYRDSFDR